MKTVSCTTRTLRCLLAGGLLATTATLLADPAAECRQEAQDYAIPAEQAADYIDGCILSRGGSLAPGGAGETVQADEAGYDPAPDPEQTDGTGQVQVDEAMPGGEDGTY